MMTNHDRRRCRSHQRLYLHEDRLSSLPDAILIDILSRLQIHNAAATSVLSHRWRNLWTDITSFQLTGVQGSGTELTSLFDRIFRQLTSASSFGHNLEKIIFSFNSNGHHFVVPAFLFNGNSLVTLELNGLLRLNMLHDTTIRLPKLKRLKLSSLVHIVPCLASGTLFKSCPLLEDLVLVFDLYRLPNTCTVVDISVPNLKSLKVHMLVCQFQTGAPRIMVSIDAPKLVNLEILDCYTSYFSFVQNPTALVNAFIDLKSCMNYYGDEVNDTGFLQRMSLFIGQMSCVRRLKLNLDMNANILPYLGDRRFIPNLFCNLIDLEVYSYNMVLFGCMKDLLYSLQRFPNLQHLKVIMTGKPPVIPKEWNVPNFVPECLASKLKTIELGKFDGTRNDVKLLVYILSNAIALEKLRVHVRFAEDVSRSKDGLGREKAYAAWRECQYSKSLFEFPRISPICNVVVVGKYVRATSDDAFKNAKNGFLTCQMYLGP